MGSFAEYSLPPRDRDDYYLDDDELIDDVPVQIEESSSVLPPQETKNLVIKKIAKNQGKGIRIKIETMPIPRAFDLEYYQDKIDKAKFNGDRIAIVRAVAIKRYADISYEFYRQVMYLFNKKNNIIAMPEYVQMCEKVPGNVESLAQTMVEREKELIKAFNGTIDFKKAFKERKHLTELKQFSAQAWMMYINLKYLKDFVGELVKNQESYNKANKLNHSHIANLYGLHVQTGYYIDANIKNFFNTSEKGLMSTKCPNTCYIYNDLNSMDEFNSILKEKNAYVYGEKHEEIVSLARNVLNTSDEDSVEKRIIGFYNHYRDMKYIKHQLRRVYNQNVYNNGVDTHNLSLYEDDFNPIKKYQKRDMFKVGNKYYKACKYLVQRLPIKSKIYKDVCDMCVELEEILSLNYDYYMEYKKSLENLEKNIIKDRPYLKEMFEEAKEQKKSNNLTISSMDN